MRGMYNPLVLDSYLLQCGRRDASKPLSDLASSFCGAALPSANNRGHLKALRADDWKNQCAVF